MSVQNSHLDIKNIFFYHFINLLLSSSLTNVVVIIMGLIGFLCELVVLGFMAAGIASNAAVVGSKFL